VVTGIVGATIVYLIVTRVLLRNERNMDPADFDMIGVLGHVSSPIRENGGIGEMIYSRDEARRASPIRSEDGKSSIPRNTEVVVTRYENGIAYVRRWDELSGMEE
jgi:membrane protein implicated in regulation of membrane protease activity